MEKDKQKSLETEFDQLKTHYEHLRSLKSDFELLEQKRKEFAILYSQKKSFDELEKKVNTYEKTEKVFKNLLDNKARLTRELQSYTHKKNTETEALKQTQDKLTFVSQIIDSLQESYKKLPETKQMEADLQQILSIFPLQEKLIEEKGRTVKGAEKIAEVEKELKDKKEHNSKIGRAHV